MNRAERRRQQRRQNTTTRYASGNVTDLPGHYDQGAAGELAPKVPGRHRFIALASYVVPDAAVRGELDGTGMTFLDHENRLSFSVGCIDCEGQVPDIGPDSVCPAGDAWIDEGDEFAGVEPCFEGQHLWETTAGAVAPGTRCTDCGTPFDGYRL